MNCEINDSIKEQETICYMHVNDETNLASAKDMLVSSIR